MIRRLVGALAALAILGTAHEASAWQPNATSQRAGGDVYWWSAKAVGSSFALVPFLELRLTESVFLDAKLPLAANINGFDDKSRFGLGNPMAGVHYAVSTSSLTWYVGGRTNIPLTSIVDDTTQQFANATAGIAMGLYDLHLWEIHYVSLGAFGGVEVPASEAVIIRAELAIPLEKASPDGKPQFLYQARGEVEARAESGIGGGGGLQLVHAVGRTGDNAQLSAEGFFGYSVENLFLRAGLLVALDEPLGFGFDKGKVVSVHVGGGTRF
jgi:hypothetical protein